MDGGAQGPIVMNDSNNETSSSARRCSDNGADQQNDDGVLLNLELNASEDDGNVHNIPPAWSVEFVRGIEKKKLPKSVISRGDDIPSVADVGLQVVRATLESISKKSKKNKGSAKNIDSSAKPTPIQLRLWPALFDSFQSKACAESSSSSLNVIGIAPTGTGKTMAYAVPVVSNCARALLSQMHAARGSRPTVHGLVLVPTRELAIQVSKEFKAVAKVANKYLSKCCAAAGGEDAADASSMEVKSLAVYGGVDIESQIDALLGRGEASSGQMSLVVAATAGRLLDILKKSDINGGSASLAFADLRAIVFDEADRIAVNADMAGQVDEILSILNSEKRCTKQNIGNALHCLVSATLPEKAKEVCYKWVPRSRIVVKIDSVKVGGKKSSNPLDTTKAGKRSDDKCDEVPARETPPKTSAEEGTKHKFPKSLDLARIPSNIVQTLHVCSNHKKPKKLILTLQRIYLKKDTKSERFSVNNRLCIVFFAQIKTVKNTLRLLVKEGLRCVELYGSLNQSERERRLLEFKAGKTPILLATDVAARGLHIPNVHYVVNYDFPGSLDQYVHRCGRAGRKHALSGEASLYPPTVYSFFPREFPSDFADSVVDLLKASNAWVDPNLLALTKRNKASDSVSNKSGRKRRRRKNSSPDVINKPDEDENNDLDNEFSFLGRSVLKRASHVSDAEDSDDESS